MKGMVRKSEHLSFLHDLLFRILSGKWIASREPEDLCNISNRKKVEKN